MEVRWSTDRSRELTRPTGTSGREDADESFIQVIGDLATGASGDMSGRSGGGNAGPDEESGPGKRLRPPPPNLRAEVEAIQRALTPEREPDAAAPPAPSTLGRVVDVIA